MLKKTDNQKDKKYVRLTRNLIEKVFDECNEAYFDNQVEKPFKFELWIPWKRCVGWVRAAFPKKEHGEDFKQAMNELNQKYGLNITVKAPFMKKEFKR